MEKLEVFKCKNCGAELDLRKAANGVLECEFCRTPWTLPKEDSSSEVLKYLHDGNAALDVCKFEDAYTYFSKAAEGDPFEPEAYFGMALASFRVQYLKDEVNNCLQPICHEISEKVFSEDNNYKKALNLASVEQKRIYRRKGGEIDDIRDEFFALQKSGLKYDCFLCAKVTGEDGAHTIDRDRANDIYYHLKDNGFKPFYSEREMKGRTGAPYEALILYALYTSECMLIVCSNEEYLQTKWVKNEYTRFISMMTEGGKERDAITFVYAKKPIEKLPSGKKIQGIDLAKPNAYSIITDYVQSHTPEAKRRREEEEKRKKAEEEELRRKIEEQQKAQKELEEKLSRLQSGSGGGAGNLSGAALLEALKRAQEEEAQKKRQEEEEARKKREEEARKKREEEARRALLSQFEIENGVLTKYKGQGGDVVIPPVVTSIKEYAFAGCTGLCSVTVPDCVTSIGRGAFQGCSALESMSLPYVGFPWKNKVRDYKGEAEYIDSIGYLFGGAKYDGGIEIEQVCWGKYLSGDKAGKEGFYTAKACIPQTLKSVTVRRGEISYGAFSGCAMLEKVVLGENVTSVKEKAFRDCSNLKELIIPNSVTSIGDWALKNCSGLKELIVPNSVTSIGEGALAGCSGLESLTLPYVGFSAVYEFDDGAAECLVPVGHLFGQREYEGSVEIEQSLLGKYIEGEREGEEESDEYFYYFPERLKCVTVLGGKLCDEAFSGCVMLERVVLGENVTSIGDWAFDDCENLTEITIPNSVTSIGERAFGGCTSLKEITIPSSITSIEDSVFEDCISLKEITIPSSVTSIGKDAFYGCDLTEITIPSSVTSIGDGAFDFCEGLKEITIPSSVTSIGKNPFCYCNELEKIIADNNPKYHVAGNCLIETESKKLVSAKNQSQIPSDGSVTSIGEGAFHGCENLTEIIIPSCVTKIEKGAFYHCSNLKQIAIPSSVTEIGEEVFERCESLTEIKIPSCITSIGACAFKDCKSLTEIKIPNSVTSIGTSAFEDCENLAEITIPSSVTTLEGKAFSGCKSLKQIEIPCGVTWIGTYLFKDCVNLKQVKIPSSVTVIGTLAFEGCENLEEIIIPSSVTKIGGGAFEGCTALRDLELPSGAELIGNETFTGCKNLTHVTIPSGMTSILEGTFLWCENLKEIEIPSSVTSIEKYAFGGCKSLKEVIIPNSVTSIEEYAFASCKGLTEITIPSSVTSLGGCAFKGCASLRRVQLPEGITSYDEEKPLLADCEVEDITASAAIARHLASKNSTKKLTVTGQGSVGGFSGCKALEEVTLCSGISAIENAAFCGCENLKNIQIPSGVNFVGGGAFEGCVNLKQIQLPNTITSFAFDMERPVFGGCKIEEVTGPFVIARYAVCKDATKKLTLTGQGGSIGAFSGCNALTHVTIASGISEISGSAFEGCANIEEVIISPNVAQIGGRAFAGCAKLREIQIPNSVTSIGECAFENCVLLRSVTIPKRFDAGFLHSNLKAIFKNCYKNIQFIFI